MPSSGGGVITAPLPQGTNSIGGVINNDAAGLMAPMISGTPGGSADLGPGGTVYHECVIAQLVSRSATGLTSSPTYPQSNGLPINGRNGAILYAVIGAGATGTPVALTLWLQFYDPGQGVWGVHPSYPTGIALTNLAGSGSAQIIPPSTAGGGVLTALPSLVRADFSASTAYTAGTIYAYLQAWT